MSRWELNDAVIANIVCHAHSNSIHGKIPGFNRGSGHHRPALVGYRTVKRAVHGLRYSQAAERTGQGKQLDETNEEDFQLGSTLHSSLL